MIEYPGMQLVKTIKPISEFSHAKKHNLKSVLNNISKYYVSVYAFISLKDRISLFYSLSKSTYNMHFLSLVDF